MGSYSLGWLPPQPKHEYTLYFIDGQFSISAGTNGYRNRRIVSTPHVLQFLVSVDGLFCTKRPDNYPSLYRYYKTI